MNTGHQHAGAAVPPASGADDARRHRRRLAVAFGLAATLVVVQAVGAVLTGSLALLVDTAHVLTDAVGLGTALVAGHLLTRPATDRHTWGLRRAEVISALAQAALLLAVGLVAVVEGVRRLLAPAEVEPGTLLVFGVVGLVANLVAVAVLSSGRRANLNMRAAFLEVVNDALGSVAVILGAVGLLVFGWTRADTVAGLVIAGLIVPRTLLLLRDTTRVLLESTPLGLDLAEVRRHILSLPHVVDVHDLHASQVSSDLPVLSAHVTMRRHCFADGHAADVLPQLQTCVSEHFAVSVEHSTFQIEPEGHAETEAAHHD